uniref:non-specific serine/threonine protein kinase n=2 Tax=Populus alba TaxID=43335 RepID=A0A4U5QN10_POPAL|nr:putative inactive leucine-rich repeat receptor-like protein kinase [Populus alba]
MAAHVAMLARATTSSLVLPVLAFVLSIVVTSFGSPDSDALLKFKEQLVNNEAISNWNVSVNPCERDRSNWVGVLCFDGGIWGLQLEHMGLAGNIDLDALAPLPSFRTLSLMDNNFDGPLPDFKKLGKLKTLYLSNNRFSGDIPDKAFEGMGSLKRLFLANNLLTGKIASSLAILPKLTELKLDGNQFDGQIPNFQQKGMKTANVANNELEGPIPEALSRLSPNSFAGNKGLCGPPLGPCIPSPPSTPKAHRKKFCILYIVIIILIVLLILAAIAFAFLLFSRKESKRRTQRRASSSSENSNRIMSSYYRDVHREMPETNSHSRITDHGKLSFLKDDIEKFDLQDLLRASAEVLGSGTYGSSYKAVVGGQAVVVKRYRHMNNVEREEFHEHMRRMGRLKHPNLLPLAAYYYRRDEKLLVTAFAENGSLASHLHGNHSLEEDGLDWRIRLKIVKGVARGLAFLYNQLPIIAPHGHLKSSNVLLDESFEPLLTDYALRPVINPEHAHMFMMAYKSPEYAQHGRSSNKTDIWSFGILILEILTGKFPENYLTPGYNSDADLATWVNNMVKEKRTSDVFDKEMLGTKNSKGEMIKLLKIGLSCCEQEVERRSDIKEVVDKIEELKEGDDDEDFYGSEGNAYSVRGNNQEGFSFTYDR